MLGIYGIRTISTSKPIGPLASHCIFEEMQTEFLFQCYFDIQWGENTEVNKKGKVKEDNSKAKIKMTFLRRETTKIRYR